MAFDINNFVIDRIVRGVAVAQGANADLGIEKGDVLFSINQIQNASLTTSSESTDAVDALGVPVATFYRAKSAEFSAENALFDMNLMATQSGTTKQIASDTNKIVTPCFETIDISGEEGGTYTLSHTPKEAIKTIYLMNGDGTTGTQYTAATTADADKFVIDGKTLTPPTGLKAGDQLFVLYEYEADGKEDGEKGAVSIVNSANNYPVGCKFIMEVLGADVCDQTNLIYAYVIFPNAKLSPDFDWSIATDSVHPFSLRAMQQYCDKEKALFQIVIPE